MRREKHHGPTAHPISNQTATAAHLMFLLAGPEAVWSVSLASLAHHLVALESTEAVHLFSVEIALPVTTCTPWDAGRNQGPAGRAVVSRGDFSFCHRRAPLATEKGPARLLEGRCLSGCGGVEVDVARHPHDQSTTMAGGGEPPRLHRGACQGGRTGWTGLTGLTGR